MSEETRKILIEIVNLLHEMYSEELGLATKEDSEKKFMQHGHIGMGISRARYLIIDEFLEKDGDCH